MQWNLKCSQVDNFPWKKKQQLNFRKHSKDQIWEQGIFRGQKIIFKIRNNCSFFIFTVKILIRFTGKEMIGFCLNLVPLFKEDMIQWNQKEAFVKRGLQYKMMLNRLLFGPVGFTITMKLHPDYKLLDMSKQALNKGAETGQPESSVQDCSSAVWTEVTGNPLCPHSKEEFTKTTSCDSSLFSTRLADEMGKSGEDRLARSCKWSWSEPDSMLMLLQRPHTFCLISARFLFKSFCSWSSCSFSFFCERNQQ